MSIAILGGGVEGQSVAKYFAAKGEEVHIFNNFTLEDIPSFNLDQFDLVFRSPSVRPTHLLSTSVEKNTPYPPIIPQIDEKVKVLSEKSTGTLFRKTADFSPTGIKVKSSSNWTSITRYFFDHCPAEIIGVTGTKGKGTTCSLITSVLKAIYQSADLAPTPTIHLVGNIGTPALDLLDKIQPHDIVVYELSSFQLWDLTKSPHIAVVTRIEPDHLDVHLDFDDYVNAKANITKHQTAADFCIYYRHNPNSVKIANFSRGTKLPYPPDPEKETPAPTESSPVAAPGSDVPNRTSATPNPDVPDHASAALAENPAATPLDSALSHLRLPGAHNRENAAAALLACAAHFRLDLADFLEKYSAEVARGLADFAGLPHRLEFVRELGGVEYYDDNYSSAFPALDVAVRTFADRPTILIAGGKDRGLDLTEMKQRIFSAKNLKKVILIGETKEKLAEGEYPSHYHLADSLEDAVQSAREFAEHLAHDYNSCLLHGAGQPVVLMSPGAASFDMFENFSDRGNQFQELVKNLA